MEENKYRDVNIVPDSLFPSDNDLEIPSLRLDVQPKSIEIPFVCYGEQRRTFNMRGMGTLHFYTDDYRFNSVYEHPEKIINHHPNNIVEPNFSLFSETPVAFGMQAIYKKRQIARQLQQYGIGVFVDMNVNAKFYKLNLLGVPMGYASFCTRGYSDRLQYLDYEYQLAKQIAGSNELQFVIYGGGKECRDYAKEHHCVYVSPMIDIKNKIRSLEAKAKITENVMFVGDDCDPKKLLAQVKRELYDNQVINFTELPQLDSTEAPLQIEQGR